MTKVQLSEASTATPTPTDQRPFHFETVDLGADSPLVLRATKKRVHVGWDPRHITHAKAVELFQLCADSAGVDVTGVDLPTVQQMAGAEEINRIIMESGDPAGAARRFLDLVGAPCPVHPSWCLETGVHEWHQSRPVQVAQDCDYTESHKHDHTSDPYIDAKLISEDDRDTGQLGAGAAVSFGECELTADGLRRETAKMRAALPRLEALADALDGKPPYVPPTECDVAERVTCGDAKGAILNAYLYTPEWEGKPDGATVLSVYAEPSHEADLGYSKAVDFLAQLDAFRDKVAVMVDALAAHESAPSEAGQ